MSKWSTIIKPNKSIWAVDFKELWDYRDLLFLFVRRDVVTVYKQTVLGPIWFFVQPIFTTVVYIFVFSSIAGLSTDGLPQTLFYLSGIIMWNYFADCFNTTADTFKQNAHIFGKVYFPRLIIPLSKVISGLIKLLIQLGLFLIFYFYYFSKTDAISPNSTLFFFPVLLLFMSGIGLGLGLIFSSLTAKYRDLKFLIAFAVQLMMYATPVIYPMSEISYTNSGLLIREAMFWNPFSHIIEGFRYSTMGQGDFSVYGLVYSLCFTLIILISGILIFNRTERNFMDTI